VQFLNRASQVRILPGAPCVRESTAAEQVNPPSLGSDAGHDLVKS
jgi:hypothetical protein